MGLAEFVERRFIPEYVLQKRAAGRAHLQAILKLILSPSRVDRAFWDARARPMARLATIEGWPYLDAFRLSDVTSDRMQRLLWASVDRGYSAQTVVHIRNVLRLIFSHAMRCGEHFGENPAARLVVPAIAEREARTLTLIQLKRAMELMRYPEKHMALFALLTDMSVGEMCGLRWKDVNTCNQPRGVGLGHIPPRALSIRLHFYRGELTPVKGRRYRFISLGEPLCSALQQLALRPEFTDGDDFVLASRAGKRVNPDNIAGRRLKAIGNHLDAPWISWKVFRQTGIVMKAQFGNQMEKEIERAITARR